jgi:peptide methionine sulfoxide reductase msrA/msrB
MKYKPLTPAETKVIIGKGTEPPFSGGYEQLNDPGIYACKRCGAYLYRSDSKFDARCGWPSFDREILGAVQATPDADGHRTEINCIRCQAHLGHVFTGEQFTPKNTRHCVSSISLTFIPQEKVKETAQAYLGGGCFWCTEAVFQQVRGVTRVTPGYAGGTGRPSYHAVTSGTTGHAEIVKVDYDPTVISFEGILTVFFGTHDPTTKNQQGYDIGTQYRSVVFYDTDLIKELTENVIKRLTRDHVYDRPIVTQIEPLKQFYPAENHHHNYYQNNQQQPYCQVIINPKLQKLRKNLQDYLIQI